MNYSFIHEIQNKISNEISYDSEGEEIKSRFQKNLKLLAILTNNIKIKPGQTFASYDSNHIYNFTVNTGESETINVAAQIPDEMYVYMKDNNKAIGFKDKEHVFRGITGRYKTNEGMFIIKSDYDVVTTPGRDYDEIAAEVIASMPNAQATEQMDAIEEKYQKEGKEQQKGVNKFKIHFYDNEAMSYMPELPMKFVSEEMIEYNLTTLGILPDEEITITAPTEAELVALANQFYLNPVNFIEKARIESVKENTEEVSIKL